MSEEMNRKNHSNFTQYQESIVSHPNYNDLYFKRRENNEIVGVTPEVTADGQFFRKFNSITIKMYRTI